MKCGGKRHIYLYGPLLRECWISESNLSLSCNGVKVGARVRLLWCVILDVAFLPSRTGLYFTYMRCDRSQDQDIATYFMLSW